MALDSRIQKLIISTKFSSFLCKKKNIILQSFEFTKLNKIDKFGCSK
jgi:hypothetical protein